VGIGFSKDSQRMQEALLFKRQSAGFLKISQNVTRDMLRFIQDSAEKPEAGGVLIGRYISDGNNIVIDTLTTPLNGDFQSRFRFYRAKEAHQQIIDKVWNDSEGTCTYLGEWHTHPENIPRPSCTDKLNWHRKILLDQFTESIFFIIVGTSAVCVWEGHYRGLQIFQLEAVK
jgi:integrative and conjugative element protein (TIGR02256 family)